MEYQIKTLNAISSAIYTQLSDQYHVSDDAANPDAILQLTNFVNSGITVFKDQSRLLKTKGLFVRYAKATAAAQAIALLTAAEYPRKL